jgi:molecular chaperone DnaK (HSP70)
LTGGLRWGTLIPPEAKRHMWTKLELDPENGEDLTKIKRELFDCSTLSNKNPVDVIADFLMQVKAHLLKNLDNRFGEGLWKSLPVTLVITVPAVWSDRAKDHTLQAVKKAGLDSLQFPQLKRTIIATEPECAAIYTIKSLHGSSRGNQFNIGDGFTVCDMGGGTVDLISYQVSGLNPTVVKEATVGSGAQCGGTFVDRRFLQWLERRLGTDDFKKIAGCRSEDIPRTMLSVKAAKILQDFTMGAKCNFSGNETYYIRLPGLLGTIIEDEDRGICDGEITLTA